MRHLLKLFGVIFVATLLVLILLPYIMGFWIQRHYDTLVKNYNATSDIHIALLHYNRHWFTSDVEIAVTLSGSRFKPVMDFLSDPDEEKLTAINFTAKQHIQHGPILYLHRKMPSLFGIASIYDRLVFAEKLNPLLSPLHLTKKNLDLSHFIDFRGDILNRLAILNVGTIHLTPDSNITLGEIKTHFWLFPNKPKIRGDLFLSNMIVQDPKGNLVVNDFKIQLHQTEDKRNIWLGSFTLGMEKLFFQNDEGDQFTLKNLHLDGKTDEENNLLSIHKNFDIQTIQLNDEAIGPIHLTLSVVNLKSDAIQKAIHTYHTISEQGELYRHQLQDRLSVLIPLIFGPDSAIQLNAFSLTAKEGSMQAEGNFSWPAKNYIVPSGPKELLENATGVLSGTMDKNLLGKVMDFISHQSLLIRNAAAKEQTILIEKRDDVDWAMRANVVLIADLVEAQVLAEKDGLLLLEMQKNFVNADVYYNQIRSLFLSKAISQQVAYALYLAYAQISQPYQFLEDKVSHYQNEIAFMIKNQVKEAIKNGYVIDKNNTYSTQLHWDRGVLKMNGKVVFNLEG